MRGLETAIWERCYLFFSLQKPERKINHFLELLNNRFLLCIIVPDTWAVLGRKGIRRSPQKAAPSDWGQFRASGSWAGVWALSKTYTQWPFPTVGNRNGRAAAEGLGLSGESWPPSVEGAGEAPGWVGIRAAALFSASCSTWQSTRGNQEGHLVAAAFHGETQRKANAF